jgi:hypothetical protein
MALPGPLGSDSNSPAIDPGTLQRIPHASPGAVMDESKKINYHSGFKLARGEYKQGADVVHKFEVSLRQIVALGAMSWKDMTQEAIRVLTHDKAQGLLNALHLVQDEFGCEIFDHWFYGTGAPEVVLETERWGNYMRAEPNLSRRIHSALARCAGKLIAPHYLKPPEGGLRDSFDYICTKEDAMEVGPAYGGYRTGYELLHGVNRNESGFQISGRYEARPTGPAGHPFMVTFSNLRFVFNDVVDPNFMYKMDGVSDIGARAVADVLHAGPPKAYVVRIKWGGHLPVTVSAMPDQAGARVPESPQLYVKPFDKG